MPLGFSTGSAAAVLARDTPVCLVLLWDTKISVEAISL